MPACSHQRAFSRPFKVFVRRNGVFVWSICIFVRLNWVSVWRNCVFASLRVAGPSYRSAISSSSILHNHLNPPPPSPPQPSLSLRVSWLHLDPASFRLVASSAQPILTWLLPAATYDLTASFLPLVTYVLRHNYTSLIIWVTTYTLHSESCHHLLLLC